MMRLVCRTAREVRSLSAESKMESNTACGNFKSLSNLHWLVLLQTKVKTVMCNARPEDLLIVLLFLAPFKSLGYHSFIS